MSAHVERAFDNARRGSMASPNYQRPFQKASSTRGKTYFRDSSQGLRLVVRHEVRSLTTRKAKRST